MNAQNQRMFCYKIIYTYEELQKLEYAKVLQYFIFIKKETLTESNQNHKTTKIN